MLGIQIDIKSLEFCSPSLFSSTSSTIENIKLMLQHYQALVNLSSSNDDSVVVWTTTPSILQTALDEEANQTQLSTIQSWNELVDLIIDDDIECRLTSDDQFLSAATYASSALLNKDLDINPTCDYLSTGIGDSTPTASSTLWVLEINPELSEEDRLVVDRARKIQKFLSQPFHVAEVFTGTPGVFVNLEDTIKGFDDLVNGKYDDIPEAAFYMVGTIEEAIEKSKKIEK